MKKTLLLKTMLLLCALIVGSNSVWADDDVTITMSQQGWSNDTQIGSGTLKLANGSNSIFTYSSGTGSDGANAGPKYYDNGAEVRFYSKKNGSGQGNWMQINVPQNTTITGVELTGVLNYTPDVKYNVDGGSDVSWTASNNKYTVSNISAKTNFTFRNAKTGSTNTQLRITAIKITYTTASSYTITAESNNTNYGTVTLSGSVITGSPNAGYRYADPAYTVSPANSATVAQNGDNFTVTPSANTTVTINFEAIPTYTVTLGDDLSTLTEATGGAGVTLPTRSTLNGYDFAGWSETNVSTETTEAPTIIPAGAYAPANDITLYPVYTKTEGSGGTAHESTSVTIADYATANNWDNGVQYASVTLDKNVKASATGGGNTGKYYTSGNEWRFYQNEDAKVTISTTSGELKSVTFTFNINNSGTLNYGSSKITSGTAVDVSGTSAEFTVGNSGTAANGQIKITAISVNYDITGVGTTYYWSNPVAAAVETPSIVVADNPFLFSTTATITCATEGATIKYSYDGENWNDYSDALTITETKTIYAKAIKGTDESTVAQVTATKNLAPTTVTISGDLTTDLNGETDVNAGTLTAAVTYNSTAVEGATVTWSSNKPAVATIDETTGVVTIKTTGEVTFTATYAGNSDYAEATGTKTVTVTDSKGPGSENNPYTVAQAIAYINTLGTSLSPTEVYVHGIISQVDEFDYQHSSITYWISDDGTTTGQMEVYSGKGLNGADFSAVTDLQVGDIVTVKGKVKMYNTTPEFNYNNEIVSLVRDVEATIPAGKEWITFCSTANLDFSEAIEGLKGAYTITAHADKATTLTATKMTGKVKAGTGLLLRAAEKKDVDQVITIPVAATGDEQPDNMLIGVTEDTDIQPTAGVYTHLGLSNGEFHPYSEAGTLAAGKAYLRILTAQMPTGGNNAKLIIVFDGEATGIANLNVNDNDNFDANAPMYNLAGQRVNKSYKGVVIVNGKKVVRK